MRNISISICPTDLEFANGDRYDTDALMAALRRFIEQRHPEATIRLQIGRRQGDEWASLDGDDEAGEALVNEFFDAHGTDESLFVAARS